MSEKTSTVDEIATRLAIGRRAFSLLRSIVADVQAMHMPLRLEEYADLNIDCDAFFGNFTEYFHDGDEALITETDGIRVHWPNLRILLAEAEKLLKEGEVA